MLYDKRWDKTEAKPDVFSVESLVAWLETKNPKRSYNFSACDGTCMLDQYADAMGLPDDLGRYSKLDETFDSGNCLFIATSQPHTFGAALDRARAAVLSCPQEIASE